jgi:hypothetical protein
MVGYTVLRAEYQLDEGEKLNNVNLKWLLGIKVAQNNNRNFNVSKNLKTRIITCISLKKNGNYFCKPSFEILKSQKRQDILSLDIKFEGNYD